VHKCHLTCDELAQVITQQTVLPNLTSSIRACTLACCISETPFHSLSTIARVTSGVATFARMSSSVELVCVDHYPMDKFTKLCQVNQGLQTGLLHLCNFISKPGHNCTDHIRCCNLCTNIIWCVISMCMLSSNGQHYQTSPAQPGPLYLLVAYLSLHLKACLQLHGLLQVL
jgi:hypothetical protein